MGGLRFALDISYAIIYHKYCLYFSRIYGRGIVRYWKNMFDILLVVVQSCCGVFFKYPLHMHVLNLN